MKAEQIRSNVLTRMDIFLLEGIHAQSSRKKKPKPQQQKEVKAIPFSRPPPNWWSSWLLRCFRELLAGWKCRNDPHRGIGNGWFFCFTPSPMVCADLLISMPGVEETLFVTKFVIAVWIVYFSSYVPKRTPHVIGGGFFSPCLLSHTEAHPTGLIWHAGANKKKQ